MIRNHQWFSDLSAYSASWEHIEDGKVVRRGTLRLPACDPQKSVLVDVPVDVSAEAREAFLNVTITLRRETAWAPAGHVVAWDQVVLQKPTSRSALRPSDSVRRSAPPIEIDPRVTIWRAAIDNDGFKLMPHLWRGFGRSLERWLGQGIPFDDADLVTSSSTYSNNSDGSVRWRHEITVPSSLRDIPRVGVWFELPARFTHMRWFGRGPHENYPDRCASAMVGVWEKTPDELPYVMPQEFGLRTDCRWVEFVDRERRQAIRIDAVNTPFHFSATHHRSEDLFLARDVTELRRRSQLVVHLDVAHRGLGTASCGPDTLPRYLINEGQFILEYVVSGRR